MMTLGCRHVWRSSGVHGAGMQGAGAKVAATVNQIRERIACSSDKSTFHHNARRVTYVMSAAFKTEECLKHT